jgi:PAS domain S-box-containing protein
VADWSDERFRGLLDAAPDAILAVAEDGSIVLANMQAERLFGYPRAELLGQPVELLVPAGERGAHPGHRERYLADPRPRPMGAGTELAARRRDGTQFPAEVSLSSVDTEDGKVVARRGPGRHRAAPPRRRAGPPGRHRPLLARRHHEQDPRRGHHQLEPRCHPALRVRPRGDAGSPRQPALPVGPARRGAADPRLGRPRRAGRALPHRAHPQERHGRRRIAHRVADGRRRRRDRRRRVVLPATSATGSGPRRSSSDCWRPRPTASSG